MLTYNPKETPDEVKRMLETLGDAYPIVAGAKANTVFRRISAPEAALKVSRTGRKFTVEYSETRCAGRGAGAVLANLECDEKSPFKTLGIMLDCSRGKVMRVAKVKEWLDKLSLLGYNMVMLYTEDTYELKEYPWFGFMRGGYTLKELRELDDYADSLGIELTGCIQTLGHLEQILRWRAFDDVKDTERVLLVDNAATDKLIEAMVAFWSKALRSRRINIGMDETHDLGRGNYMDRRGCADATQLFNAHLANVNAVCRKNGLEALMWSDMFFRLSNPKRDYYDLSNPIPESVKKTIPRDVKLGYWDYYHDKEEEYLAMIEAHRKLGFEPVMVSGVWTWSHTWCHMEKTEATALTCVAACYKAKVAELIFTMWGDDGAYCIFDSAMTELARLAGVAFGDSDKEAKAAKKRFAAICGIDYDTYSLPAQLEKPLRNSDGTVRFYPPSAAHFIWDDPLAAHLCFACSRGKNPPLAEIRENYVSAGRKISAAARRTGNIELMTMAFLAEAALSKIDLRIELEAAYAAKDRRALKRLATKTVPETIAGIEAWMALYRIVWLNAARPNGLDTIQRRTGGALARLKETQLRVLEYLDGDEEALFELDCPKPKVDKPYGLYWYRDYAECSRLF